MTETLSSPVPGYIDCYYSRTLDGENISYAPLRGDGEADVCVIGGGLAGINTALGLIDRGKSVAVLEAKRLGWGASGRNGGFVAKGYAADQGNLTKRLGLPAARRLVDLTKEGRNLIRRRIARYNIDCGPLLDGVLTVSVRDREAAMRDSVARANDDFDLGLEYWPTDRVRSHCKTQRYFQGSISPHDFQFHPLRYLQGLAKAITDAGGTIHENSPALAVASESGGWRVRTAAGSVRARDIVLCCASYGNGLDRRMDGASFPVQTFMMVTKPIPEDALDASLATRHPIYDTRWASDYYRRLPDNRILWGGRVSLRAEPGDIARTMIGDMLRVYPQLKGHAEAETAWAGLMCYAPHKMPMIGTLAPGYWYNTGFGGHGLVPTTVGGEVVAGAIAGNDNRIGLFEPFRAKYAGGPLGRYVAQMVYWIWCARDYMP